MLPIVTGIVASSLNVLAIPHHLHALAPRGLLLPVRAGTTGGYWGMAHGAAVMLLGLVGLSVRRLAEIQIPLVWGGFAVGLLLMILGLLAGYRSSRLDVHDHPHTHDGVAHEHIHLHYGSDQVHDHGEPELGIPDRVLSPPNLMAVLPALVLTESQAVLYLVMYLVFSVLAMGGLGYWLGDSRRRGDDATWVLRLTTVTARVSVAAGIIWVVVWWPL